MKNPGKKVRFLLAVSAVLTMCSLCYAEVVDKVIVVVNDEVVTQREFDRMYEPMRQSYEANFKGDELERRLEMARKGLLEQLINSKLTISLAKKNKVKIDEAELDERVKKIESYYGSRDEFLQALKDKGTNYTEFEQDMRDQMIAQKYVEEEVSSKIVIAPADIKELYDKNKEQLVAPKRVKARGMLIRKMPNRTEEESKKKADEMARALKKKKDFAAVAMEYSEGPYAKQGGDMGFVAEGQLLPEIDKAIFALKKGEQSGVVESPVGYHIFIAEEVEESRQMEFDEISDFLKQQLFMRRFEQDLMQWLEAKREKAYISYK
jgi:parvulin-like peptidyl-prolyl isomerase